MLTSLTVHATPVNGFVVIVRLIVVYVLVKLVLLVTLLMSAATVPFSITSAKVEVPAFSALTTAIILTEFIVLLVVTFALGKPYVSLSPVIVSLMYVVSPSLVATALILSAPAPNVHKSKLPIDFGLRVVVLAYALANADINMIQNKVKNKTILECCLGSIFC